MKHITLTLLTVVAIAMNINARTSKDSRCHTPLPQQLIQRMQKIQKQGYMYAHQDDTFYGITWAWEYGRSDTYDLVGDFPGVMGFELGGIERGDTCNLNSVPFEQMRREAIRQHERGGIITFSWHPRNPLLGTTAWIGEDIKGYEAAIPYLDRIGASRTMLPDPRHTVGSVIQGGEKHELFLLWLARVADFLCTIRDTKGNPIPFIFRPWHENNGAWFWWGEGNCSAEEFHALWNMTQDYLNARLYDNIVWSYSPNLQGNWTRQHFMERYPGNDRVDLIGEDAYQWGTQADFVRQLTADLDFISAFAQEGGKLIALTECGLPNSTDPTWWTQVLKPVIDKYPVGYCLAWRNDKNQHFGASKDAPVAEDFKEFHKAKNTLFVNDIRKIK